MHGVFTALGGKTGIFSLFDFHHKYDFFKDLVLCVLGRSEVGDVISTLSAFVLLLEFLFLQVFFRVVI
jgi:hypothetical protein